MHWVVIHHPPSSVEAVISGIRVLSGFLRRVKFSHVRRQCNRPMHQLVRVVGFIVWLEENHKYKIILNIFHMVTCQTRMCQGFWRVCASEHRTIGVVFVLKNSKFLRRIISFLSIQILCFNFCISFYIPPIRTYHRFFLLIIIIIIIIK